MMNMSTCYFIAVVNKKIYYGNYIKVKWNN